MNDWITLAEFEIANCKASSIFDTFCKDKQGCESDWVEIEVDGKFFPTHIINGDRQTDGTKSTPLFINMYGEKFIPLSSCLKFL